MNSPQVPIWVPVFVGVIGVLGVIAGQLVNAWREDRRWRREIEREDLRWTREQAREKESLRTERRVDCYSQLAILISRWFELFVSRGGDFNNLPKDFKSRLIEFQAEGDRICGLVNLLGSPDVAEAAFLSVDALRSNNRLLLEGKLDREHYHEHEGEYSRNLDEANKVIEYARVELGFQSKD